MSLSTALSNALSGLQANTLEAELIANNVANASTPGYTRRAAELSAVSVGGDGAGVQVSAVQLVQDNVAISNRRRSDAELGLQFTALAPLQTLGAEFGVPGDGTALADKAAAFENALASAASDPASEPRLSNVVNAAGNYANEINALSTETQHLRMEADREIGRQVDQVNTNLSTIELLNREIKIVSQSGGDASALVDERKALIDEISSILPIRTSQRDDGQVSVFTENGTQLVDPVAVTITFTPTTTITQDMTQASGALSGLSIDGRSLSVGSQDGSGMADGGSLGQLFLNRDTVLPEVADQLDLLAEDLVNRFQDPGIDGTRALGDPGLITDDGGAYDTADLEGLAGRISVNALVDPTQGGETYRLRDGLGATAPGVSGNSVLLEDLLGAATSDLTPAAGSGFSVSGGVADFAAGLTAAVTTRQLQAESSVTFAAASNQAYLSSELGVSGVNTDAQLQRLLQVEQAYSANALVMSTINDLYQRLLEI